MTYYDHSSQQEYRYMNEMGDKGWELVNVVVVPAKNELQPSYEKEKERHADTKWEEISKLDLAYYSDIKHVRRCYWKRKHYRKRNQYNPVYS